MEDEVYIEDASEQSFEAVDTDYSILDEFEANPISKLSTKTLVQPEEKEQLDFVTPKRRGRPRKNPVGRPKKAAPPAEVYELQEEARDLAFTEVDKWEQEKAETVEKLSAKAVRDLDAQIKRAKREQAESTKVSFEKGYESSLTDEELEYKNTLLQKINMYYKFYQELEDTNERRGKWSLKTNTKDLQDEIARCERHLAMDRSFNTMKNLDFGLNFFVETIAIKAFSVPCHGLAAEAKKSQMLVEEELKELSIKYHEYLDMGPEVRYFFKFAQRLGLVLDRNRHLMNRGVAPVNSVEEEKNLHNKYEGL